MNPGDIFDALMAQIHQRAQTLPEGSYTTKLIRGGTAKMGAKILEEALETILAASESGALETKLIQNAPAQQDALGPRGTMDIQPEAITKAHSHLVYEACDLIYHLWVLLGSHGVTVDHLRRELERREGISGLDEKKSRTTEGKSK